MWSQRVLLADFWQLATRVPPHRRAASCYQGTLACKARRQRQAPCQAASLQGLWPAGISSDVRKVHQSQSKASTEFCICSWVRGLKSGRASRDTCAVALDSHVRSPKTYNTVRNEGAQGWQPEHAQPSQPGSQPVIARHMDADFPAAGQ